MFAFARQGASPEERLAFDLDEPVGVIYATKAGHLIAQVYNDSGAKQVDVSVAENFAEPFSRFQLAHAARLRTDQRLGRDHLRPGPGTLRRPCSGNAPPDFRAGGSV